MKRLPLLVGLISLFFFPAPAQADLYFPHVDTNSPWGTEIAIINTSTDHTVVGTLKDLSDQGELMDTIEVTLMPHARRQISISDELTNHTSIGYLVFETESNIVQGYIKFYIQGTYRVAVPAVKEVNTGDIYISHIDSDSEWWTGLSLVNTTSSEKVLTITFGNGQTKTRSLPANGHDAFTIAGLFDGQPQPSINSAVITNASGIVGLELFGSTGDSGGKYLSGILLKDNAASTIYYPHIASDETWWTGIVAYNPSSSPAALTLTPYGAGGGILSPQTLSLPGKGKYIGTVAGLGLPNDTAWFKIESTHPLTGFELFGTTDGNQLAGYTGVGINGKEGVFAKVEQQGWTGIAFVNIEDSASSVTLTAYDNYGEVVATQTLSLGGFAKEVRLAQEFFSQDIGAATYIGYASDRELVGFQLNGSSDGMMLDGLPGRCPPEPPQQEPGRYIWVTGENTLKYGQPDLYLKEGTQTSLNSSYFDEIEALLDVTGNTLFDIVKIFRWKKGVFSTYKGEGVLIGISTANTIYEVKKLSGCHDHGLIMASVLRKYGFPVLVIDTADVQWAKNFNDGIAQNYLGHVFLEVYVDGSWILIDSTSGDYALDYNHDLSSIHYAGKTKEYFVLLKGLDTNDCDVFSRDDLYENHMEPFADQVYDLTWTQTNYTDKNLNNYENDLNNSCPTVHDINLTVDYSYTGVNTVDANHQIMIRLDKYTSGTILTLKKFDTASGFVIITDSEPVYYVFLRIGMDKDGNGKFSSGDPIRAYTDAFDNRVGIPITSPATVSITFDDSVIY